MLNDAYLSDDNNCPALKSMHDWSLLQIGSLPFTAMYAIDHYMTSWDF